MVRKFNSSSSSKQKSILAGRARAKEKALTKRVSACSWEVSSFLGQVRATAGAARVGPPGQYVSCHCKRCSLVSYCCLLQPGAAACALHAAPLQRHCLIDRRGCRHSSGLGHLHPVPGGVAGAHRCNVRCGTAAAAAKQQALQGLVLLASWQTRVGHNIKVAAFPGPAARHVCYLPPLRLQGSHPAHHGRGLCSSPAAVQAHSSR